MSTNENGLEVEGVKYGNEEDELCTEQCSWCLLHWPLIAIWLLDILLGGLGLCTESSYNHRHSFKHFYISIWRYCTGEHLQHASETDDPAQRIIILCCNCLLCSVGLWRQACLWDQAENLCDDSYVHKSTIGWCYHNNMQQHQKWKIANHYPLMHTHWRESHMHTPLLSTKLIQQVTSFRGVAEKGSMHFNDSLGSYIQWSTPVVDSIQCWRTREVAWKGNTAYKWECGINTSLSGALRWWASDFDLSSKNMLKPTNPFMNGNRSWYSVTAW